MFIGFSVFAFAAQAASADLPPEPLSHTAMVKAAIEDELGRFERFQLGRE